MATIMLKNMSSPTGKSSVALPRRHFRSMVLLVRLLYRIGYNSTYRRLALAAVPEWARFNPGHDAVMMGFDFHLTPAGPKLIEVNTNAGGGLLALQASGGLDPNPLRRLRERLHRSFREEWSRFPSASRAFPARMLILDDKPEEQYLYPEMLAFADLFREWGADAFIAGPEDLSADTGGVFLAGEKIDLIYNRHCDFYLEEAALEGIRRAYLNRTVCLSPNPFTYALLADKRRSLLWLQPELQEQIGLTPRERTMVNATIPESHLLAEMDAQQLWRERREWVIKPTTGFGSRGVLLGKSLSRARFATLDPQRTLVQRFIPPSTTVPAEEPDGPVMKTDFRLFAYRNRLLGIAARLYQGQVTNLRSPGAGFVPVKLI